MRFCRDRIAKGLAALSAAAFGLALAGSAAAVDMGYAVVPTTTIYPGESVTAENTQEVAVTNPNLAGDYAKASADVVGRISKRTLLPGRTIPLSALREPYKVTRGSSVRLTFSIGAMVISASGTPLEDGATGQVIRARNLDSGIIVSGTVLEDGTIRVAAK